MLLKSPNKRTSSNRFIKTISIIIITLILALLMFLSTKHFIDNTDKSFEVRFYDKDTLLEVVHLEEDERISSSRLEEINSLIETYDDLYHIEWSYRKNELVKVDFDKLNTNANVYLFKLKNEYSIKIDESEKYNAKVRHDGPIKYGSKVTIDIDPLVDTTKYHVEVSINGIVQTNNEDYTYDINITEDVVVNVALKEIIEIIPNKECKLVYNNIPLFAGYSLVTKEGNLVETNDVLVKYMDESGNVLTHMLNAGRYTVSIEYTGDTYYAPSIETFELVVEKATPSVSLDNNVFYYNAKDQSIDIEDIITNSDGEIVLSNNIFNKPGSYNVIVNIKESKNYKEINKEFAIVVNKGIPTITSYPVTLEGFEYNTLSSISLDSGVASVLGRFTWVNGSETLTVGANYYQAMFIPDDEFYEIIYLDVLVDTISTVEQLRRIKIDRLDLYNEYKDILDNNVYGLSDLPTSGNYYDSSITWLSNSSSLMVDRYGNVNLLDSATNKDVTLTALITYGNAAEYVNFDFTIFFVEEEIVNTVYVNEEHEEVEIIPTLDEIIELLNNNKEIINTHEFDINDMVIVFTPREIIDNQNINIYEYNDISFEKAQSIILENEHTSIYMYKARCKMKHSISEIILWKIISDSAGANGPNDIWEEYFMRNKVYEKIPNKINLSNIDIGTNKIETKQKDIIINFMKGEK